ncbi:MAG: Hpt domain-containing protein [Pseudomonadota bacterium]
MIETEQLDGIIAAAGVDGASEIMAAFWRSTDDLLLELRNAVEAGDFAGVGAAAHALKGSASNVGAALLADNARDIEDHARNSDKPAVASALTALEGALASTQTAFSTYFAKAS